MFFIHTFKIKFIFMKIHSKIYFDLIFYLFLKKLHKIFYIFTILFLLKLKKKFF